MKEIYPKNVAEWRAWLEKNHQKEDKVRVIKYKKHTGKPSLVNNEAMMHAICFGWIDTTVKRIDDEKYVQHFSKRNKNSRWSKNTLSYGKDLMEKGLMNPFGIKMYQEGLLKKPLDFDLPENPDVPEELKIKLDKNKLAKEKFEKMVPSMKKMYLRMILRAKMPETKLRRIDKLINDLTKKL